MTSATIFCKVASLFLRIFLSRYGGKEVLGSYMMLLPVISLFINICQAGVPSALFTLSANPKYEGRQLLFLSGVLCLGQMLVCFLFLFLFQHYFLTIQTHFRFLICFIFFTSMSALLRSYHLGKQQGQIPAISQVLEEIMRIAVLFYFYYSHQSITLSHALQAMLAGEIIACLYMMVQFKTENKSFLLPSFKEIFLYKEILSISLPVSTTQLIHGISHALEPVLFQIILLRHGYSQQAINTSYGILNGCVFSLLMIPTFLNTVIYKILLPKIASTQNKIHLQHLVTQSMVICLGIGLPFSIFFFLFPDFSLSFLFGSTEGSLYLKYLSLPFLIFYLQTPLQAYLQAYRKQNILLRSSLFQSVVSLTLLVCFLPSLGPSALAFSYLCGLICHSCLCFLFVYKDLFLYKK